MPDSESGKSSGPKRYRTWYRRQRRQELLRRWSTITVIVAFLGSLLAYQNRDLLNPWRERAAVREARELIKQGDRPGAILRARDAVHLNPRSLEGSRLLAELLDEGNSRETLDWRQRVAQIEPNQPKSLLALARSAERWEDWVLAGEALGAIPEKDRSTAVYHELAASVALGQGQAPGVAEAHYAAALQIDPANETNQLNLARLQLRSDNEASQHAARLTLERLKAKPALALPALRVLAAGAGIGDNTPAAVQAARELAAHPAALLVDRFTLLGAFKQSESPEFSDYLRQMESLAITNAPAGAELIRWMTANGLTEPAVEWARKLPSPVASQEAIVLALAEALTLLKDWDRLEDLLEPVTARENEFLRQAYLARAYREKAQEVDASESWRLAVRAAQKDAARLARLAQIATSWNWTSEAEEAWWTVAKGAINKDLALSQLGKIYRARNDTHGLYRVARQLHQIQPKAIAPANDTAALALLLSMDRSSAIPLAQENYSKEPTNPVVAATYLYSLQVQGKVDEALGLVSGLSDAQLQAGKLPLYAGLVFTAAGKRDEARRHLEAAGKIPDLLTEEKGLLAEALKPPTPSRREKAGARK
ncbi:MAG: hypothetical protein HY043_21940 [Verrucomicrobia bacterium]|nr:hypothetical protein [Verrucomicrobiota bacterium]